jgi:ribosomal protein S18 acetylase RimI-like enzyme
VVLKVTYPVWTQEKEVRAIVKRCGPYVSTYRALRNLQEYYDNQWVGLLWEDTTPVGFWVIRHGKRNQWTTIHEIGVVPEAQRRGFGERMVLHLLEASPWHRIRLVCDARNDGGLKFYDRLGFQVLGERLNRAGETIVDLELS